jgi:hypothetical protein
VHQRQIAEFIEHDEVHATEIFAHPPRPAGAALGFEFIDQLDDVEEPATLAVADQRPRHRDHQMRFAGAGPADQHDIALVVKAVAAGKVADQRLVDS